MTGQFHCEQADDRPGPTHLLSSKKDKRSFEFLSRAVLRERGDPIGARIFTHLRIQFQLMRPLYV